MWTLRTIDFEVFGMIGFKVKFGVLEKSLKFLSRVQTLDDVLSNTGGLKQFHIKKTCCRFADGTFSNAVTC